MLIIACTAISITAHKSDATALWTPHKVHDRPCFGDGDLAPTRWPDTRPCRKTKGCGCASSRLYRGFRGDREGINPEAGCLVIVRRIDPCEIATIGAKLRQKSTDSSAFVDQRVACVIQMRLDQKHACLKVASDQKLPLWMRMHRRKALERCLALGGGVDELAIAAKARTGDDLACVEPTWSGNSRRKRLSVCKRRLAGFEASDEMRRSSRCGCDLERSNRRAVRRVLRFGRLCVCGDSVRGYFVGRCESRWLGDIPAKEVARR